MPTSIARRILLLAAISASALSAAVLTTVQGSGVTPDEGVEAGLHAFEASDYNRAAQLLQEAAARNPQNADIQLLLAKTYYETQQHDAAIASAEASATMAATAAPGTGTMQTESPSTVRCGPGPPSRLPLLPRTRAS